MNRQTKLIYAAAAVAMSMALCSPATALTMKECSAKYKEAQKAGTLNNMKWNDFRKAQCGSDAAAAPAGTPAATTAAKPAETKPATTGARPATTATGSAVFPSAIDPKYSKESAGRARMKTCTDQYNANKANNGNGGLKWIEKGGGYWSECNKKLKGA